VRGGLRLQILLLLGGLLLLAFVPLFFAVATYTGVTLQQLRVGHARALGRAIGAHVAEARASRSEAELMSLLRAEVGRNFTDDRTHIPEDFLFRAGGSRSNRGYAFQSLGVQEGEAIVGGRVQATGTVEYVHWLNERWGAAAFVDVGDAKDSQEDLKPNPSYGVGARFKTPAGPFAIDLAYAQDPRKFRLAFSVTVAF
jgi:outer membrane translocation and assembly module TamA